MQEQPKPVARGLIGYVLAGVVSFITSAAVTAAVFIMPRLNSGGDLIALLGLFVAAATFVFVSLQIWIAFRQTDLQEREIVLVEDQGKILARQEAEMNRKARLILWCIPPPPMGLNGSPSNDYNAFFQIYNFGNRTADACRIHLLLPDGFGGFAGMPRYEWKGDIGTVRYNALDYRRASLSLTELFFQDSVLELSQMRATFGQVVQGPVLYRLVYADGATPDHAGWLELRGSKEEALRDVGALETP